MSAAVPYLVDPAGAAIHDLTGFKYTPGGAVSTVLNPPKRPAAPAAAPAQPVPTAPTIKGPAISAPGPGVPPATRALPPDDKAGAGPGTDATKGLLKKSGVGKTLLG
jgi:hypothetical protein